MGLWVYELIIQIEQNYMANCTFQMDDLQTQRLASLKHNPKYHHHIQSIQTHTHHTSLTEQQIYARDVVREIIHREKSKIIRHEIGKVDTNSSLYARPCTRDPRQFRFNSIPPQDPNYSSLGSAKIHQINKGMRSRATTASLTSSKRYTTNKSSHKKVDPGDIQVKFSRISVSGLATYKFASIKAERSLAMNRTNNEEKLEKQLQSISKRRDCALSRIDKILLKQSSKRFKDKVRRSNKTIGDFQTSTHNYLQDIMEENDRERLLYGDKAQKLEFIKDYMNLEQADYDVATHIIQQIERCREAHQPQNKERAAIKTEINQEQQFARRRRPLMKSRLKVRYVTFAQ